jgi:hypothetical protein
MLTIELFKWSPNYIMGEIKSMDDDFKIHFPKFIGSDGRACGKILFKSGTVFVADAPSVIRYIGGSGDVLEFIFSGCGKFGMKVTSDDFSTYIVEALLDGLRILKNEWEEWKETKRRFNYPSPICQNTYKF